MKENLEAINKVLSAMWEYVELDASMAPLAATWSVPEWRS